MLTNEPVWFVSSWRGHCSGCLHISWQSLPLPWQWQNWAPFPQPSWSSSAFAFELPLLHPLFRLWAGFDKSCWAKGSSPRMGKQQPCSSQMSPSMPEPVPGVGSINGTQQFQPGFQSKQRDVGSHSHESQHCCRSPFWKKCEIYCNTHWGSYGGSELLNPLNLSLQLHWQGLSLHSAPSLWFHCSNIFPYMEAFLPQPGLILTCHCIWMLAHFSQLTLCKGRCLNLLLFKYM